MILNVEVRTQRMPPLVFFTVVDEHGEARTFSISPMLASFAAGRLLGAAVKLLRQRIAGAGPILTYLTVWIEYPERGWKPIRCQDLTSLAATIANAELDGFGWVVCQDMFGSAGEKSFNPEEAPDELDNKY